VLVAPSGGILPFWPAATVLLFAACLLPLLLRRRGLDARPALVLGGVLLVLSVGFASWWTPFGWSAYGPRLMLPWILPLVLLGLVAYGDQLGELAGRLLAPTWRLVLVFAAVLALALPHVGWMWRPESTAGFFAQAAPCEAPWRGGVQEWQDCQQELAWASRPMMLYPLDGLETVGGAVSGSAVAAALLGCLILLRDELAVRRARPSPRGR
jgi:hypothetical protein